MTFFFALRRTDFLNPSDVLPSACNEPTALLATCVPNFLISLVRFLLAMDDATAICSFEVICESAAIAAGSSFITFVEKSTSYLLVTDDATAICSVEVICESAAITAGTWCFTFMTKMLYTLLTSRLRSLLAMDDATAICSVEVICKSAVIVAGFFFFNFVTNLLFFPIFSFSLLFFFVLSLTMDLLSLKRPALNAAVGSRSWVAPFSIFQLNGTNFPCLSLTSPTPFAVTQ